MANTHPSWKAFLEKHKCEPKNATQFLKFVQKEPNLQNINFRQAKQIINANNKAAIPPIQQKPANPVVAKKRGKIQMPSGFKIDMKTLKVGAKNERLVQKKKERAERQQNIPLLFPYSKPTVMPIANISKPKLPQRRKKKKRNIPNVLVDDNDDIKPADNTNKVFPKQEYFDVINNEQELECKSNQCLAEKNSSQQLVNELLKLNNELSDKINEYDIIIASNADLKNKIKIMNDKNVSLQKRYDEMQEMRNIAKKELIKLKRKETTHKYMPNESINLKNEIEKIKKSHSKLLKESVNKLKKELEDVRVSLNGKDALIKEYESKANEFENIMNEILNDKQNKSNFKKTEHDKLKNKMNEENVKLLHQIKELKQNMDNKNNEIKGLQNRLALKENAKQDWQRMIEEKTAKLEAREADLKSNHGKLLELQKSLADEKQKLHRKAQQNKDQQNKTKLLHKEEKEDIDDMDCSVVVIVHYNAQNTEYKLFGDCGDWNNETYVRLINIVCNKFKLEKESISLYDDDMVDIEDMDDIISALNYNDDKLQKKLNIFVQYNKIKILFGKNKCILWNVLKSTNETTEEWDSNYKALLSEINKQFGIVIDFGEYFLEYDGGMDIEDGSDLMDEWKTFSNNSDHFDLLSLKIVRKLITNNPMDYKQL